MPLKHDYGRKRIVYRLNGFPSFKEWLCEALAKKETPVPPVAAMEFTDTPVHQVPHFFGPFVGYNWNLENIPISTECHVSPLGVMIHQSHKKDCR